MHYAVTKPNVSIVKLLILAGSDINAQTLVKYNIKNIIKQGGDTPLMRAISFNCIQNTKFLLRFGGDMFFFNKVFSFNNIKNGVNSKTMAIMSKNHELIEVVLSYEEVFSKYKFNNKFSQIVFNFVLFYSFKESK